MTIKKFFFKKIISLFLEVLLKFKYIEKIYQIDYEGEGVSLNDYYSGAHWSARSNIKKKYGKIFKVLINEKIPVTEDVIKEYIIVIFYNTRHDVDNVVGIEKLFTDQLHLSGKTLNDTKSYFKGLIITEDSTMKHNSFKFLVCKLK
jgi:hypothetical protein